MNKDLELVLLEAIWLTRWNPEGTSMSAVLSDDEALQMCKNIVENLYKNGWKIIKK